MSINSYSSSIFNVLKELHPDLSISKKAMEIMDSFVKDIFQKIASEAGRLARYKKNKCLTSREIQTAVRLIIPGDLAKHCIAKAQDTIALYGNNNSDSE